MNILRRIILTNLKKKLENWELLFFHLLGIEPRFSKYFFQSAQTASKPLIEKIFNELIHVRIFCDIQRIHMLSTIQEFH